MQEASYGCHSLFTGLRPGKTVAIPMGAASPFSVRTTRTNRESCYETTSTEIRCFSLPHSLEEAQSLLAQSHKAYAKIKPCAASLRSKFLRAKMQDPDLSPAAMQEYSQLVAREEARDHASLMRRIKGKARSKAIAEIKIPVGNDWELVSEQASVEQHISQH